jgi:hypothetical protein
VVFPFKVQDIVVGCIKLDDVNNIWTSEGVIYELEMLNKEELRFFVVFFAKHYEGVEVKEEVVNRKSNTHGK